jgi:hypothetical protein
MKNILLLSILFFPSAAPLSWASVSGPDVVSEKKVELKTGSKGSVLVFLSAECPCSNSHIEILKKLAADFPHFSFLAVHSNQNESLKETKAYFQKAALPFPIIQDAGAKIADEYKALKTPHAFLLAPDGSILYKGGVTSSANGPSADSQYLRDALAEVEAGKPVSRPVGRTLGCIISRSGG